MNTKLITAASVAALALALCLYATQARAAATTITYNYMSSGDMYLNNQPTPYSLSITAAFNTLGVTQVEGTTTPYAGDPTFTFTMGPYSYPTSNTDWLNLINADQFTFASDGTITSWNVNLKETDYPDTAIYNQLFSKGTTTGSGQDVLDASTTNALYTYINNQPGTWSCEQSPVPEPNTTLLLMTGLGLICIIRLSRKFKGQVHIA